MRDGGIFGPRMPTLIASMDARTIVPETINLGAIARLLGQPAPSTDREAALSRARSIWLEGRAAAAPMQEAAPGRLTPRLVDVDGHATVDVGDGPQLAVSEYTCRRNASLPRTWTDQLPPGTVGDWCPGHAWRLAAAQLSYDSDGPSDPVQSQQLATDRGGHGLLPLPGGDMCSVLDAALCGLRRSHRRTRRRR